jgi:hypothetical protein
VAGAPSDLEPLKEPLIEAVINGYMMKEVPDSSELEWDWGGCKDGQFRYKQSRLGFDYNIYCSYPGGEWKVDVTWSSDDDLAVGEGVGDLEAFDAAAAYAEIRDFVSSWIDPWADSPDPTTLSDEIARLAEIANLLYVDPEVIQGDPVGGDGDEADQQTTAPVASVSSAIADMSSRLSSLQGLAVDALEASYVNDVGLTISGQRALAGAAALAVAGEAEAWFQTYTNLAEFLGKAQADFNSFAGSQEASGEGGATTLSAVSGVTGLGSLATAAFPPASVALGAISGLAGIGATFWPTEDAVADVRVAITGGSYPEMLDSFTDAIMEINGQLVQAEHSLARMCRAALDNFYGNPNAYSITAVGRSTFSSGPPADPQPGDNLSQFLQAGADSPNGQLYAGDRVVIVHTKLRQVAGMIAHVGDHQRSVAGRLDPSVVGDDWSRASLPPGIIGWGPSGHRGDCVSLVDTLTDLLLEESATAHRVAEHCFDISTDFTRTEDQVEAGLRALETRLYP